MKVLKADQVVFEKLHMYKNKNDVVFFVKDASYNWVCSCEYKSNPNFIDIKSDLDKLDEIEFQALIDIRYINDEDKKYIEIPPVTLDNYGYVRAEKISRELHYIELPKDVYNDDLLAFPVFTHESKNYIQIDLNRVFNVHSKSDINELSHALFGTTDNVEFIQLREFLKTTDRFVFNQIIPSTVTVLNHSDIFN